MSLSPFPPFVSSQRGERVERENDRNNKTKNYMKNISKIGMAVVAGCMFAATSCSDYSDYNTVPEDAMLSANKTLWENISESENLQDFAAIIAKAGYTQNFSAPQYYTVWAPVDGTYDAQAILAKDSATIVKEFIGQHMATYSHVISGEVNKRIVSLNDKHHVFTNEAYDGIAIKTPNVATTNGVMHLLNGQSEYHPNLYEEIDNLKDCESFKAYIWLTVSRPILTLCSRRGMSLSTISLTFSWRMRTVVTLCSILMTGRGNWRMRISARL